MSRINLMGTITDQVASLMGDAGLANLEVAATARQRLDEMLEEALRPPDGPTAADEAAK